MKKNGFRFYLLVTTSSGLGTTPPAPQGLSYIKASIAAGMIVCQKWDEMIVQCIQRKFRTNLEGD